MKLIIALLFISNSLFSQEINYRVVSEKKEGDTLTELCVVLSIINKEDHPICIRASYSFSGLTKDTIKLAWNRIYDCPTYGLGVSQYDEDQSVYDIPHFPLILNARDSFVATVSILVGLKCEKSIVGFSYIDQPDISIEELKKRFEKGEKWDSNPKIKLIVKTVAIFPKP